MRQKSCPFLLSLASRWQCSAPHCIYFCVWALTYTVQVFRLLGHAGQAPVCLFTWQRRESSIHCLLFCHCDLRVLLYFINPWEGLPLNRTMGLFLRSTWLQQAALWLEAVSCVLSRAFSFLWPRCITVSDTVPQSQIHT